MANHSTSTFTMDYIQMTLQLTRTQEQSLINYSPSTHQHRVHNGTFYVSKDWLTRDIIDCFGDIRLKSVVR